MHDDCKTRKVPFLAAIFHSHVVNDFLSGYWKVRIPFQPWYCSKEIWKEGFCDLGHLEIKLWTQILLFRGTHCVSLFLSLVGYSSVIAHGLLKREYITVLHALPCMEIWKGKGEWKESLCRDERKFCTIWKYMSLNEDVDCCHQHVDRIVEVQRFQNILFLYTFHSPGYEKSDSFFFQDRGV
jgi:hypothetical protein